MLWIIHAVASSQATLMPGQPVMALTLLHLVPGREAGGQLGISLLPEFDLPCVRLIVSLAVSTPLVRPFPRSLV